MAADLILAYGYGINMHGLVRDNSTWTAGMQQRIERILNEPIDQVRVWCTDKRPPDIRPPDK